MTQAPPAATEAAAAEPRDVIVIGGGPAGSTLAALLAEQGRSVLLLDKAHHPRFHIGESLLPANVPMLERMGLREAVARIGMPKWGVEFVAPHRAKHSFFEFGDAWDKTQAMSWQVRRSEFDELLFRHAAGKGARTLEGCRARQVDFDDQGATVHAVLDDGRPQSWRARFVIDASGRDTLLANQFGTKRRHPRHASAAIFGHFTGARRLQGEKRAGHISIFWFPHGWFWFIPLADGSTSIGATCWPYYLKSRDKPLEEFFFDTIAMVPRLAGRLEDAQLIDGKVHATGNFSYTAGQCCGERWLMLGDAYAFIDPVFSSGVYLAMVSAFAAVDVVAASLDEPTRAAAARRRFVAQVRRGPSVYSWFIFRMTSPALRDLFMRPHNALRSKEAVLSVLGGDIYGGSPIWASLAFFKLIYYLGALRHWPRSWAAWRKRRHSIRDVGALPGETVQVPPR